MPNISQHNRSQHKGPLIPPDVTSIFAALGDDTRLAIIWKLQDGSTQSISKLSVDITLTRQGVSRHLQVLEDAGVVSSKRVGREARYRLEVDALKRAQDYLQKASNQWDAAILRLTSHLEN